MELELSLREGPSRPFMAAEAAAEVPARGGSELGLEFRIGLGSGKEEEGGKERGSDGLPVQHNLLHLMLCPGPSSPRLGFPLAPETSNTNSSPRDFDMNQAPCAEEGTENSANRSGGSGESGGVAAARRSSPRVSEEDNWPARKKLRLTREQSALLEQNFMQHNILNPQEKLALAKRLNLRPRQVEVWFQNRRARTKLKQREVEWYHLKRCWETLREENRRLQKELCALEMSPRPFSMNLPATALSTCPSCEGVGPTAAAATSGAVTTISMAPAAANTQSNSTAALFSGPRFYSPTTQEAEPPPQPPAV